MTEIYELIGKGWTPGGVGIWTLVLMALAIWWKGLPAVLDAWTNSVTKEREHREREIARLEKQIASADQRHDECLEGQRTMRAEIDRLNAMISGFVVQMRQVQISALTAGGDISPTIAAMLTSLEKVTKQ